MNLNTVVLHTCCAPCSAAIIEWLLAEGIQPLILFYNPNIYPESEYEIRKNELVRYAKVQGLEVIDGDYNHLNWLNYIIGLEHEPERGKRCLLCFKMRMLATAQLASQRGIETFATSLASSRWKDLRQITQAGQWAAAQYDNVKFWEKNWRKDGLSERRRELINKYSFYNQKYCGCEFHKEPVSVPAPFIVRLPPFASALVPLLMSPRVGN